MDGYRESSASRNSAVALHGGFEISPGLRSDLHVRHSEDTTGFPGGLTLAQTEQRRIQTNSFHGHNVNELDQVSFDLTAGPWDGWTALSTVFWKRWIQTSEDSTAFNAFTVTPSRGLNLRLAHQSEGATLEHLLTTGLELMDDKAVTGDRDAFAGQDSESHRKGYGLYAEETLTLDRTSLTAGVRFDQFRYQEALTFPDFIGTLRFQGWSPKLGLTQIVVLDRLNVFASYARPFKAPNVDDFSARTTLNGFRGNADLEPQQADAYEIGARFTHASGSANATWFYSRINDEILFNQPAGQNQNFDTRRTGLEVSTRWQPPEARWRSSLAYTFVAAKFIEGTFNDNTIPGTPEHTVQSSIGVSPMPRLWIDLDWRLVHDARRINDLTNTLGGADNYGVLNLRTSYDFPTRVGGWPSGQVYLRIENVTNEEYVAFQSSNGSNLNGAGENPMPPIGVTTGVTIRF